MKRMEDYKISQGAYSWSVLLRNSFYAAEPYRSIPPLASILAIREVLFNGLPWQPGTMFNIWNELKGA